MNTLLKGSALGAAGVTLLVGSYGTYSLWNDEDAGAPGVVTAGELDIMARAAVWDDRSTPAAGDWDPGDLVVPGDTITMTQDFLVTATGKNLEAELVLDRGEVTSGAPAHLTVTAQVDVPEEMSVDATNPGRWVFSDFAGTRTVTATVTYRFDPAATAESTEGVTAAMTGSTFTVTQLP